MPLDDISKQHQLDVVLQRLQPRRWLHALDLGEAADLEVSLAAGYEPRARTRSRYRCAGKWISSGEQCLGQAVWEDLDGQASPAQLCGDLGVQQLGRGPAEHDTHHFRVQDPSYEPRPAGDHLDLVQEQVGAALSRRRMCPVVRLQQIAQEPGLRRLQAVVLEVHVENVAAVDSARQKALHLLIHEIGLA